MPPQSIFTVDSHTMGEPTRVVIGGIPYIPGNSMAEKRDNLQSNMDYIRKTLMLEPRGHDDMFGAIITQPVDPTANFGVIYMDTKGYLNMCGHGTIGVATVAVEMGMIPKVTEPFTEIVLDTPAGLVKTQARVIGNKVKDVTFQNVPSFVFKNDHKVSLPQIGEIAVDIAFGGSFFGIVPAKDLGIKIEKGNKSKLVYLGMEILDYLNTSVKVVHPLQRHINSIDLIEIFDDTTNLEADYKNCVIFGKGQVDRSPCGTGISAKLAVLYAKKKIRINQVLKFQSIMGSVFCGYIVEETKVGDYPAIIPKVTGSAFITGIHQFLINLEDPLHDGFSLT